MRLYHLNKWLGCTVRIRTADLVATAFLVMRQVSYAQQITFVVTNKHVLGETRAERERMSFTMGANRYGPGMKGVLPKIFHYTAEPYRYCEHGDETVDIAAVAITDLIFNQASWDTSATPLFYHELANEAEIQKFAPGDFVVVSGYPDGLTARAVDHRPLLRRGMVSTYPWEDTPGHSFIIDSPVFEGASGSPVFWDYDPQRDGEDGRFMLEANPLKAVLCLGIVTQTHWDKDWRYHLSLGIVQPATFIRETISTFFGGELEEWSG